MSYKEVDLTAQACSSDLSQQFNASSSSIFGNIEI